MRPDNFLARLRCLCLVVLVAIPLDALAATMLFSRIDSAFTWLWAALGAALPMIIISDYARPYYSRCYKSRKRKRQSGSLMVASLISIIILAFFPIIMTLVTHSLEERVSYNPFSASSQPILRALSWDGASIYAGLYPEAFHDTEQGSAEAWLEDYQEERGRLIGDKESFVELRDDGSFLLTAHRIDHSACLKLVEKSKMINYMPPTPVLDARETDDGKRPYVFTVSIRVNGKRWMSVDDLPAQDTLREMCADDGEERIENATLEYILEERFL